jgi:uncharacterized protein (TIGR02266 family)
LSARKRVRGASKSAATRQHERVMVELPVFVREEETGIHGGIRFDAHDLSLGGAFLRSDLLFEVGEEVDLEFDVAPRRKVRARARVVRVIREQSGGPPGMGIAFVDLSESDREALRAFLARAG